MRKLAFILAAVTVTTGFVAWKFWGHSQDSAAVSAEMASSDAAALSISPNSVSNQDSNGGRTYVEPTKGRRHRPTPTARVAKTAPIGSYPGSESQSAQDSGYFSIYPQQRAKQSRSELVKPKEGARRKVVHGVDLEAWAIAQKDAIASLASEETSAGLRVFVGCMEWKKEGLRTLTPSTCQGLALKPGQLHDLTVY